MSNYHFPGFAEPTQNWTKVPNVLFDCMAHIDSLAELKVIHYILRHTWGFGDAEKRITVDEFMHGRKRRDGSRLDAGTGLSNSAVQNGLKLAVQHGFIEVEYDRTDRARVKKTYRLRMLESDAPPAEIRRAQADHTASRGSVYCSDISGIAAADKRSEKDTLDINLGEKHMMGAGAPAADRRDIKIEKGNPAPTGEAQMEVCSARTVTSEPPCRKNAPRIRPHDALFDAIAEVCHLDPATAGPSIGKVAATLRKASPPYTPEEVRHFGRWWEYDNWRSRQGPPSVWKLCEMIGMVRREGLASGNRDRTPRSAKRNSLAEMLEAMRTPEGREALVKRANELNWFGGLA